MRGRGRGRSHERVRGGAERFGMRKFIRAVGRCWAQGRVKFRG